MITPKIQFGLMASFYTVEIVKASYTENKMSCFSYQATFQHLYCRLPFHGQ